MTGALCLFLGLTCLWFWTIVPLYRNTRRIQNRRAQEAVRANQALAVRHYYPGLTRLTPKELRATYDVESAYNQIGRLNIR